MAPEQFEAARITPATDMYGIGAVLYWILTRTTPSVTGGDDSQLDGSHDVPLPRRQRLCFPADVGPELRDLCERCLALCVENRTILMSEISKVLLTCDV
jgi:serine/threonine protein kinase